MDEKKQAATLKKELSYDEKVIRKIAGIATDGVQGVLTVSGGLIGNLTDRLRTDDRTVGIAAAVGKKQVALDLNVVCEYGRHVPRLFDEVAERVGKAVLEMTGLELVEFNMHVDDVLNKEDFEHLHQQQSSAAREQHKQEMASQNAPVQTSRVQ